MARILARMSNVRNGSKVGIDDLGRSPHRETMNAHCLATAMLLLSAAPAVAQSMSDAEVEPVIAEIQASHIEANVPDEAQFAGLLERDLNAYFATRGIPRPREPL